MLLDIKNVEFKNFFSFGAQPTKILFKPGIHLITGKNGRGKTSAISSISFALFGCVDKEVNNAEIINWKNRKNCEVSIEFKKGNDEFRIERGLKPNILKLYENGKEIPNPSNKKSFQDEIENDILGLDFYAFNSLVHSNPNNFISIFKANKAQKRKFIEQLFGLESLSQTGDLIKEKIAEFNIDIARLKSENSSKTELIASLKNSIETMTSFIINNNENVRLLNEVNNKLANYNELEIKNEIEKNKKLQEISNIKYEKILTKFNQLMGNLSYQNKNIIKTVEFNLEKYNKIKEIVIKESDFINDLNIKSEEYENDIQDLTLIKNQYSEVLSKNKILTNNINNLESKIKEYESLNICPTCGQDVKIPDLTKEKIQLKESKKENELVIKELNDLDNKIKSFELKIQEQKVNIKNLNSEINEINELKITLKDLEIAKEKKDEKITQLKLIKKLEKFTKILEFSFAKYLKESKDFNDNIQQLQKKLDLYMQLLTSKVNLEEKIKENEESIILTKQKIDNAETEIASLKKQINDNANEISTSEKIKQYFEYLKEICKDENVKQFAISEYIPFLNTRANHYLSEAQQPYYIKLDGWLDLLIKGAGVSENSSYGNLSGGESKLVDLSMQMSFLDIAKIQSKVFPNILCLDEILDTSVDYDNLQKLLNIIQTKQKEDNLSIYIVSHRNEIDSVEFDSVINIIKENGYSKIT